MIIGIGGCSNSGKSALAKKLVNHFGEEKSSILCQDDFVKYSGYLTKIRGHVDWEQPTSIKRDEYLSALTQMAKEKDFVFAEGLFAFYFPELLQLYDKTIFLSLDRETFRKRKKKDLRWGKEPDWYIDHIYDSYLKYGRPAKNTKNLLEIDASQPINIETIINHIKNQ